MKVPLDTSTRHAPFHVLRADKANPRDKLSATDPDFLALVESIKRDGIIEPLVVRPDGLIVCGHRRYAAAARADLAELPVVIRDVPDEDLRGFRLVENLHRKDLSPMEESDAFIQMEKGGMSEIEIGERAGISPATVRRRLKLQDLPAAVKKALRAQEISTVVATAIATIPDRGQALEALDYAREEDWHGERPTDKNVLSHIQSNFMTLLDKAPFDLKDETLNPKRGACTSCPMNTACEDVLFDDLRDDNAKKGRCTDQQCFIVKRTAHVEKILAKHREKETRIWDPEKAEDLKKLDKWFSYRHLSHNSPWVRADQVPHGQPKNGRKSLKTLIAKSDVELVVLIEPLDRIPVEVFNAKQAAAALRELHKWASGKNESMVNGSLGLSSGGGSQSDAEKERRAAEREKKKKEAEIEKRIAAEVIGSKANQTVLEAVVQALVFDSINDDTAKKVIRAFDLKPDKEAYKPGFVREFLREAERPTHMAIAIFIIADYHRNRFDGLQPSHTVVEALGIDHAAIGELVEADMQVERDMKRDKANAREAKKAAKEAKAKEPKPKKPVKKRLTAAERKARAAQSKED